MSRDRRRKISAARGAGALSRTVFKSFWKEEKVALTLTAWEVVPPLKRVWIAVPVQTALPDLAHVCNTADEGKHELQHDGSSKREQIQPKLCRSAQVS